MKKILSLLVLMAVFTSCEEDVKFNTPAVQGFKNNELWKADAFTATLTVDGSLVIQATSGLETVVLKTSGYTPATYTLAVNDRNKASYSTIDDSGAASDYQTIAPDGTGQIIISGDPRETDLAKGYISGSFHFNAVNDEGVIVYFADGVFYKVPITGVQ